MNDVTPRRCQVFRVPTAHPADIAGVLTLIASGTITAAEIMAIFGKTEGNGCVNDFTRAYAATALQAGLAPSLGCTPAEVGNRIAMVMSGGTEGGLSPHLLVFCAGDAPAGARPGHSLAIGTAFTRDFLPEELGRMPQIEATAEAVAAAMIRAGITVPEDVHYVQVKCPLLTGERVRDAAARGQTVVTTETYPSMGYARGASALGVALALNEVPRHALDDAAVCRRFDLWSGRASTSAGIELMHNAVIVLGNSAAWASEAVIAHRVMRDAIDLPAVVGALADVGSVPTAGQLDQGARDAVLAVLAKADPSSTGRIRGARHIMLDDSDINATRHARALVGGVLAGVVGRTDLFVSGGAEHQGPDGGGPVAVIARRR
ncbi:ring-opening amidohydrolase [Rhodopila sp.]|uniref:cyanuric acid amidohydrolase n=1 Tax=Rhodopila sp. TaxID=2480087 RepID=UPI003D13EB43